MNKEESIALLQQGRDAWNAWAAEKLTERKALEDREEWFQEGSTSDPTEAASRWQDEAAADFSDHTFDADVDFSQFIFPGATSFHGATFEGDAVFSEATYEGHAVFWGATFKGDTEFGGATFKGFAMFWRATFKGFADFWMATFKGDAVFWMATFKGDAAFGAATFEGNAEFRAATFKGKAGFGQCRFTSATVFSNASFEDSADFGAIEVTTSFSLAGATFHAVPDFIQAHFAEAPRCDNLEIVAPTFRSRIAALFKRRQADADLPARWRALKRLAIQGHDHAHEQIFFKGELLSRRWHADRPWHGVFWFGVLYQFLSDFGRSLFRPLAWWGLSVLVFTVLYLSQQPASEPHHCANGDDTPVAAAFDLSVRNALLFVGQTSRDKLRQDYACLYGPGPAADSGRRAPPIPYCVVFLGHVQNVLSAVFIFLLLLALRNHFRIK